MQRIWNPYYEDAWISVSHQTKSISPKLWKSLENSTTKWNGMNFGLMKKMTPTTKPDWVLPISEMKRPTSQMVQAVVSKYSSTESRENFLVLPSTNAHRIFPKQILRNPGPDSKFIDKVNTEVLWPMPSWSQFIKLMDRGRVESSRDEYWGKYQGGIGHFWIKGEL